MKYDCSFSEKKTFPEKNVLNLVQNFFLSEVLLDDSGSPENGFSILEYGISEILGIYRRKQPFLRRLGGHGTTPESFQIVKSL